jgi:uncharacterized OB-fold protein
VGSSAQFYSSSYALSATQLRQAAELQLEMYRNHMQRTAPKLIKARCGSCGSSEFKERGDQTVCAYCRTAR